MKKFLINLGILVLLVLSVGMLFLIKRQIPTFSFSKPHLETITITPQKLSDIAPVQNFEARPLQKDAEGRVLSVPENADSLTPPEERTFVY
ncbi:hypothetical protein K9L27_03600 [Candidatus Gracilibacteria bacterium]|nr:hypothetical protein [Candidatus Gracilibacteria bacterium]